MLKGESDKAIDLFKKILIEKPGNFQIVARLNVVTFKILSLSWIKYKRNVHTQMFQDCASVEDYTINLLIVLKKH